MGSVADLTKVDSDKNGGVMTGVARRLGWKTFDTSLGEKVARGGLYIPLATISRMQLLGYSRYTNPTLPSLCFLEKPDLRSEFLKKRDLDRGTLHALLEKHDLDR